MTILQKSETATDSSPQPLPGLLTKIMQALVGFCAAAPWRVIFITAVIAVVSGYYAATHFTINADTNNFLSAKLPWRVRLEELNKAFPQGQDQIIVVIDAATPELAETASTRLFEKLEPRHDLFQFIDRPDGGPYFQRNAFLFPPTQEVARTTEGLMRAQPFLATLAADPSLRGVIEAFSFVNRGVRAKVGTYDDFDRPIVALADALDGVMAGKHDFFSWRQLFTGAKPDARELRRFISTKPVLDSAALQPGRAPSDFIRQSARDLGFTPENGVTVRLTGTVPLADEEFSTVEEGFGLNGTITGLVVIFIIWLALKSAKIVFAVALTVAVGLAITAAAGIWMVGALNLISVAFAVLFVGIGADFGIQFSVRYRAERYEEPDFHKALVRAAGKAGRPLLLAAAATTAGFYSFLPTDYRGVSQLGLIAGTGMIIAFLVSITLLPALLTLLRPPAERDSVGFNFLAPVDDFLSGHRRLVVIGTLAVALIGTPLLRHLNFDFNPLNLRSHKVESVATLLDLDKDPSTDPNSISILTPSLDAADPIAARLQALPEVAQVVTLKSFVPQDQEQKLPLIEHAASILLPLFDPQRRRDPPTPQEEIAAMEKAATQFSTTAENMTGKGADDARRLARLIDALANAPQEKRDAARALLVPGLEPMLSLMQSALQAKPTGLADIPDVLRSDWVSADGKARISVAPRGDANNNATMTRFVDVVEHIAPDATGEPVAVQESGTTIVHAFIEAGIWALLSISILLYIVLRRVTDVLMTLVPLLLAGLLTLEITVLIDMPLNFANIIALPLMLGLGVAFKIYFVMAWRGGTTNLLQSSLTRAVFFSAMTTATAFGSLWLSNHPGTSSMGKLLALSLVCTLAAAILFQPALMGPPRVIEEK
jgi:hopanoid biosynthesis associated RND transporter like protein HpnN